MGKWMAILLGLALMAAAIAAVVMFPWVRGQFFAFVVGGGVVTVLLIGLGLAAYGYGELTAGEVEMPPAESGEAKSSEAK